MEISEAFVFVGHGIVQHAGNECRGEHHIRYYSHLILKAQALHDEIVFTHEESTVPGSKSRGVFTERSGPAGADSEGGLVTRDYLSMKLDRKRIELELSAFTLEAGSSPDNNERINRS